MQRGKNRSEKAEMRRPPPGGRGGVDIEGLRAAWARQQRGAAVVEALFTVLDVERAGVLCAKAPGRA